MYVDLFLLYLLYKFTKPQKKLKNGMTIASAILFAHDRSKAGQVVMEQIQDMSQERSRNLLMRKHA